MQHDGITKNITGSVLALMGSTSASATSYDWSVIARVTAIEVTYMPSRLDFRIDQDAGNCPKGALLFWNARGTDEPSQIANTQAVLSAFMTAKASGQSVMLFGNNSDCTVSYAYIV